MPTAKIEEFDNRTVKLSAFAKALGHPIRVTMLKLLARQSELACMAIVNQMPLSQPACSRHLAELVKAGLVRTRTSGNQVFYRVDQKNLDRACKQLTDTLQS